MPFLLESSKPGPSGSPARGASLQAPPLRSLISRQVGRMVSAVAISACVFRRIGRAKYLETLDCGTLMERTDLLFCPGETPESDGRGLNTAGAFHRECESGLILRKTLPSFVSKETRGRTAPGDLLRTIDGLKELLRVACSKLADPLLTPFDRREARNQIRQHSAELRRYLQAIEARRVRERSLERDPDPARKQPELRLLA